MPIGSPSSDRARYDLFREIYEDMIAPAVVQADSEFRCVRADDIRQSGNIVRDIVTHLVEADLVIADLTDQNPNVFYELGVRHALSRPVLLLAQKIEDVPFDLRSYRTIVYGISQRAATKFKAELSLTIRAMFSGENKPDGPVADFLRPSSIRMVLEAFEKTQLTLLSPEHATIKSLQAKLEQLQRGQKSLENTVERLAEERNELLEDVRQLDEIREGTRALERQSQQNISTDSISGYWGGVSGRLRLRVGSDKESITGDYDWKGFPMVGHIAGKMTGRVLKFRWKWDKSPENGNGFFVCDEKFTTLTGGWFSEEDEVDLDQAIEGQQGTDELIHPWSFKKMDWPVNSAYQKHGLGL